MPIERYAIAVSILGVVGFLSLVEAACGTTVLAEAARNDAKRKVPIDMFRTSLFPLTQWWGGVLALMVMLPCSVQMEWSLLPFRDVLSYVAIFVIGVSNFYGVFIMRYRQAIGQSYVNDACQVFANIFAAILIMLCVDNSTSVLAYVAFLLAPTACVQWMNVYWIWRQNRGTPTHSGHSSGFWALIVSAVPLFVGYLGVVIEREVPKLYGLSVGASVGVAQYGCFIHFANLASSVVLLVLVPLTSQLTSAASRGDEPYKGKLVKWGIAYGILIGGCMCLALSSVGRWLLPRMYGKVFAAVPSYVFVAYGIWLGLMLAALACHHLTNVLGGASKMVKWYIINGVTCATLVILIGLTGRWATYWSVASILAAVLIFLPQFRYSSLKGLSGGHEAIGE